MRLRVLFCLIFASLGAFPQEPGSGNISVTARNLFVQAYNRGGFSGKVSLPPVGDVRRYGSTGLIQEYFDLAKTSGVRYALVKPNMSDQVSEGVEGVYQVMPDMYAYYNSIGPNTAGYPVVDTQSCPVPPGGNSCVFQTFDKNYALFVWAFQTVTLNGTNFAVRDPFFSRWRLLSGINLLGAPVAPEETVTSKVNTAQTGVYQRFQNGGMYNFTAGTLAGRLVVVQQPAWDTYLSQNAHLGFLGFPVGEPLVVAGDQRRQNFEGGAIDYTIGGTGSVRLPVASLSVNVGTPTQQLNLGESVRLEATTFASNGAVLAGRAVTWLSSNTKVLTVEPSGASVTMRAVGGGSANISAVSEGKTSRLLSFFVFAPCCQVGEGAPNTTIQQSFSDAAARNRLNLRLPGQSPVRRVGTGYVQEVLSADGNTQYLLAKPDTSSNAYIVTGAILAAYQDQGGPGGALGYPTQDPSVGGRQAFQGGALSGNPVVLVTAPILARWAAQGYENSVARHPSGPPENVLSFTATQGVQQPFTGGAYAAHSSGSLVNRVFFIGAVGLAKYASMGGASGSLGLPVADEVVVSGRRRQEFEGGFLSHAVGEAEVSVEEKARRPQISANPSTVSAGARVRVAAGGFAQGATLRISVGGQPDFLVETRSGAYAWEIYVPVGAASQLVNLRAADANGTALAVGSYLVQSSLETLTRITKLRGDLQTGFPGARLPLALRVVVRDDNGSLLAGVPVRFNASPGAAIEDPSATTDLRGEAQAFLRLPNAEVPALATASAGGQVVTFSARTSGGSLSNFPKFTQAGEFAARGALLVASAAIVRHLQNNGDAGTLHGPADPAALNSFLRDVCLFDAKGQKFCDGYFAPPGAAETNVNPWRLAQFVGGGLGAIPVPPDPGEIRDALSLGHPVLVALAITAPNGTVLGSHFVVAVGVGPSGEVLIHDPSPTLNRTRLDEYLNGFQAGQATIKALLGGAIRIGELASQETGFVLAGTADLEVASRSGKCGVTAAWPGAAYAGSSVSTAPEPHYFRYCAGSLADYQFDAPANARVTFLDLSNQGGTADVAPTAPSAFRLSRVGSNWNLEPLQVAFSAASVLNAASLKPALSPGVLAAVVGTGLARSGQASVVDVGGIEAAIVVSTPFQLSFRIPVELPPGAHVVRIQSPYGVGEAVVELAAISPALFGGAFNQNGSPNGASNPVARGGVLVAYGTGFGATRAQGNLQVTVEPVTAFVNGREVQVQFAGAAPGLPGVYQFNLGIPAGLAPSLEAELRLRQGGIETNGTVVAVQ